MKKDGDSVDEDMVNNENVETDGERSSVVGRGKPVRKGSVPCKLPLSRISGFVAPPRVMCLFCDRSFLNAVFLQKHTNRYHRVAYSRRSSSRNSDQTSSASQNYHPGCSFCNSKSLTVQKSDDLSALFHHLLDMHSLKYFGCRFCQQRFLNSNQLKSHNQTIHPELQKTVDCDNDVISFSAQLTPNETGKEQTSSDSLPSSFEPIETDSFDLNPRVSTKRNCLSTRSKSLTSVLNSDSKKELRSRKASNKSKNIKSINKNPQPTCSQEQLDKNPVEIKCHSIDPKRLSEPIVLIPTKEDLKLTRKTAFDKNGISESIDKKLGKLSRASVTLTPVKIKTTTNNDTQMLSRLGLAQNRSPRTQSLRRNRKTTTVDHRSSSELSSRREKSKGKNDNEFIINKNRIDPSAKFDPNFYSTVSENVRENLLKHLDGKLEKCKVACDVPDVIDPKIRSTHAVLEGPVSKQPAEIHGSNLALNAITIFPTLLAPDQYGSDKVPHYSYGANSQGFKKTITKNSWKWKWDITKKVKPIHDVGRRDLSRLDIWTQLTMRERYDKDVFPISHSSEEGEEDVEKGERRRQVKELNAILDSRVLPDIQNELKLFGRDGVEITDKPLDAMPEKTDEFKEEISETKLETMKLLGLTPNTNKPKEEPPVFSGEWQRPRCYVCCVCGIRADCLRLMEAHQASQHPYAQATYYELVGKEALDNQLYKHLYIPGSKRNLNIHKKPVSPRKIFKLNQSTRILRTAARNIKSQERPCTKCNKLLLPQELHKHILECAGDYAWMMSKKKCKNKPFGVRRRRLKGLYKRERPQDEEQSVKDSAPRPKLPPRPRSKPSDVETIQRMLANLPPKRTSKQVMSIPSPKTRKILNNQSRILRRILPDSKIQRSTRIVRTIKDGKMRRVTRSITNKKPVENKNIENNSNTQNEITSKVIKDVVKPKKDSDEKSEENNELKNKKSSTGQECAANSNDLTGLESVESINDEVRSLRKRPKAASHQPSLLKTKKCPQRQNVQAPSDGDNHESTSNTPNAEASENENKQNVTTKPSEINVPPKPKSGNSSKRKSKKVLGLPLKWIGKRTKMSRFRKKKVDSNLSLPSGNENIGAENRVNNSEIGKEAIESEKKIDNNLSSELSSSTENKCNDKTDEQPLVSTKINSESEIQNVDKLSAGTSSGDVSVMSNEKTIPVMTLSNDSHGSSNMGFSNHGNQSLSSGSSSSNDFRLYDSSVQGTSISGTENKTAQLGYNHNLGYYLPSSLQITSRNASGEHFEQSSDMNKADDFAIDNIDKPPLFSSVIAQSHMKEIRTHEAPVSYAQSTNSQKQYSHHEANLEFAHNSHLSKSKMSNKSKRGLNDCIAMLRGKLSEKSVEREIIQSPTLTPNNSLIAECSISQDDESLQPLDLSGKCQAEDLSMSRHSEGPENLSIPKPKEDWQEVQDLSMKSAMKTTKSALLNVRKPVYDPTLRIPQFLTTSEQSVIRPPTVVNQTNYVMDASPTIPVGKSNILHGPKPVPSNISHELALLPQTLVNTIEKLPPTQQEEIVKVLPQVLVKAVENYNLFRTDSINRQSEQDILKNISTSLSKPIENTTEFTPANIHAQNKTLSLPQTSEISTQTFVLPKEEVQKCPPEYLNVNTDLFLIDPISGLISERKIDKIPNKVLDTTKVIPMKTRPHEIIDLTDDNISKEPEEILPAAIIEKPKDSETNVRSVVIIDPSSIDKNKPIELNKITKGTASLRAVRIKSTSEKMKIKNLVMTEKSEPILQVLAQPTVPLTVVEERNLSVIQPIENVTLDNEEKISVQQESTENAITSSKDMKAKNKESSDANVSDINEAAAIQQDEVSSTQHSSVEDTSDIPADVMIKNTLSPLQQKIADICNKDLSNQKEVISMHEPALSKSTDSGVNECPEIIANTPCDKNKSKVRKLNTRKKRNRTKKMKKVIQIIEPPTHKENSKEKDSNAIVDKRDKGEPKSNDLESDKKISFGNLLKECNSLSESAVTPSNAVDFHTERKVLEKCENIQMNEMMQEDVDVDRNISVRRSLRTKKTILKESMPPLEKDINIYQNRDSSNGIEPVPDLTGAIIPEDSYKANLGSNTETTDKETVSTIQDLVLNKDESDDDDICLALFTKKSAISEKRAEIHVETTNEELSSNKEKPLQECSKPEILKEKTKAERKTKTSDPSYNNEKILEECSKSCDEITKVERKTKKAAQSSNNEKTLDASSKPCEEKTKAERRTKKSDLSSNNEKIVEESSKPSEETTKIERKTKRTDPSSNTEKTSEESSKPSEEKTKMERKTKKSDLSSNNEKNLEESSKPVEEMTKKERKTKKSDLSSNNEKNLEERSKPAEEMTKKERKTKKSDLSSNNEKNLEERSKPAEEMTKVERKSKKAAVSSINEKTLEESTKPSEETIKTEKKTKKSAQLSVNENILDESSKPSYEKTKIEKKTKKSALSANIEKILQDSSKPSDEITKNERKTKKSDPSLNTEKIFDEISKPSDEKSKKERKTKKSDPSSTNEKILEEYSKPAEEMTKVERRTKKSVLSYINEKTLEERTKPSEETTKSEKKTKKSAQLATNEKILDESSILSDGKTKLERKTKRSALSANNEKILLESSEPCEEMTKVEEKTKRTDPSSNNEKILEEISEPCEEKTKTGKKTKKSALSSNSENILQESSKPLIEKSRAINILVESSESCEEKTKPEKKTKKYAPSANTEKILEDSLKSSDEKTKVESKTKKFSLSSNSEKILQEGSKHDEKTKIESRTKKSALSSNNENILEESSKSDVCDERTNLEIKIKKSALSSNNEKVLEESLKRDICEEKTKIENKIKKLTRKRKNLKVKNLEISIQCFDTIPSDEPLSSESDLHNSLEKNTMQDFDSLLSSPEPKKEVVRKSGRLKSQKESFASIDSVELSENGHLIFKMHKEPKQPEENLPIDSSSSGINQIEAENTTPDLQDVSVKPKTRKSKKNKSEPEIEAENKSNPICPITTNKATKELYSDFHQDNNKNISTVEALNTVLSDNIVNEKHHTSKGRSEILKTSESTTVIKDGEEEENNTPLIALKNELVIKKPEPYFSNNTSKIQKKNRSAKTQIIDDSTESSISQKDIVDDKSDLKDNYEDDSNSSDEDVLLCKLVPKKKLQKLKSRTSPRKSDLTNNSSITVSDQNDSSFSVDTETESSLNQEVKKTSIRSKAKSKIGSEISGQLCEIQQNEICHDEVDLDNKIKATDVKRNLRNLPRVVKPLVFEESLKDTTITNDPTEENVKSNELTPKKSPRKSGNKFVKEPLLENVAKEVNSENLSDDSILPQKMPTSIGRQKGKLKNVICDKDSSTAKSNQDEMGTSSVIKGNNKNICTNEMVEKSATKDIISPKRTKKSLVKEVENVDTMKDELNKTINASIEINSTPISDNFIGSKPKDTSTPRRSAKKSLMASEFDTIEKVGRRAGRKNKVSSETSLDETPVPLSPLTLNSSLENITADELQNKSVNIDSSSEVPRSPRKTTKRFPLPEVDKSKDSPRRKITLTESSSEIETSAAVCEDVGIRKKKSKLELNSSLNDSEKHAVDSCDKTFTKDISDTPLNDDLMAPSNRQSKKKSLVDKKLAQTIKECENPTKTLDMSYPDELPAVTRKVSPRKSKKIFENLELDTVMNKVEMKPIASSDSNLDKDIPTQKLLKDVDVGVAQITEKPTSVVKDATPKHTDQELVTSSVVLEDCDSKSLRRKSSRITVTNQKHSYLDDVPEIFIPPTEKSTEEPLPDSVSNIKMDNSKSIEIKASRLSSRSKREKSPVNAEPISVPKESSHLTKENVKTGKVPTSSPYEFSDLDAIDATTPLKFESVVEEKELQPSVFDVTPSNKISKSDKRGKKNLKITLMKNLSKVHEAKKCLVNLKELNAPKTKKGLKKSLASDILANDLTEVIETSIDSKIARRGHTLEKKRENFEPNRSLPNAGVGALCNPDLIELSNISNEEITQNVKTAKKKSFVESLGRTSSRKQQIVHVDVHVPNDEPIVTAKLLESDLTTAKKEKTKITSKTKLSEVSNDLSSEKQSIAEINKSASMSNISVLEEDLSDKTDSSTCLANLMNSQKKPKRKKNKLLDKTLNEKSSRRLKKNIKSNDKSDDSLSDSDSLIKLASNKFKGGVKRKKKSSILQKDIPVESPVTALEERLPVSVGDEPDKVNVSQTNDDVLDNTILPLDSESLQDKFLADFGMYTEKRPRKSTLVAMKKISKTFKPDTEDNWEENKSEDGNKHKKITKKVKKSLIANDTKIDPIYKDFNKHNEEKARENLNTDHFTFQDEIETSPEKCFSQKFRDKSLIKENVPRPKTIDTSETPPHDQFIQKSSKTKTIQSSERTLSMKSTNSKSLDKERKKEKSVGDLKKETSHKNKASEVQTNSEEIGVDVKSSEEQSDSNVANVSSSMQLDNSSKSDSCDDKEFSSNTADENRNIDPIFPKKADDIFEKKTRIPSDNYCLLCKKKFRRHENLLKHQMTLMHISRVSEVEAKERENQVESANVNKIASADPKTAPSNSRGHKNLAERKSFDTNIKITTEIQPVTQSPLNENLQISSDYEKPSIEISTDSSRKTLSTDEALFFECCSLLKESNDIPIPTTVDPVPESYPLTSEQNNSSSDSTPYTSGVKNILKASKLMPPSLTGESDNTMELSQTDSNSDIHPATEERVFSFVANSATEENKDDARNNFKHFLDSEMIFTSSKETEELNKTTENNSLDLHKSCSGDYDPYSAESLMVRTNSDDFSDNGDSIVSSHDTENTSAQNITKSLLIPTSVKAFSQPVLMNEFEDKFDKIKRKAREKAQAAQEAMAAVIAPPRSHSKKSSKKSGSKSRKLGGEKKSHHGKLQKSKNKSKRRSISALSNEKTGSKKVLTKAALKGFDSVKVSINSEELNFRDVLDSKQISMDKDLDTDYESKNDKFPNETTEKKFNLTPKSVSSFGKMHKEKSQSMHKFEEKDSTINSEKHDIYEFMDDEEDNMSDSFKFRTPTVVNRTGISKKGETPLTTASCSKSSIDVQNDDSQISSLSFSDRDDFTYMSDDYNAPDSGDESNHSSNSLDGTPLVNKNSKKNRKTCKFRNTKKNAIMGKIFKNVIKSNEQSPENDGTDNLDTAVSSHTDMDQLFDSLLDRTVSENNQTEEFNKISADATDTDDMYSAGDEPRLEEKTESNPRSESDSDNDERNHIPVFPRTSQRKIVPRLKARSSDDETISPPKPTSMHHGKKTEIGVASHKSQRKCTTGKQNVLVESWSSESDYEDFRQFEEYSSIPRSQKHHRRPRRSGRHRQLEQLKVDRSESLDSSKKSVENFSIMEEEPKLNYTSGKNSDTDVCNTPNDSKEDYNNLNLSNRRAVSFTPNISFKSKGSKRKRRQSHKPFDYDDEFKPTRIAEPSTTQRRNKRPASEMLYYWSSSSDDDEKNVSNDLSGRESEPVEQHGWIVGDSHKKLVTMLAHAKGRKVDDNSSVKEKKCRPS